eukprot:6036145-Prymnesium_polylepis.1
MLSSIAVCSVELPSRCSDHRLLSIDYTDSASHLDEAAAPAVLDVALAASAADGRVAVVDTTISTCRLHTAFEHLCLPAPPNSIVLVYNATLVLPAARDGVAATI